MNNNVKILSCYYKSNDFVPKSDIYIPIQCGVDSTGLDLGILGDNTGDNISGRNRYWSEITGLYWAWKNMTPVDIIGLCSYRRFFNFKHGPFIPITKVEPKSNYSEIDNIKIPDIPRLLDKYDIIVPKKYWYAYSIRNVCRMNYNIEDFRVLQDVINELYPDYSFAFKDYFERHNYFYGHNMFIMRWSDFDAYCKWVFDILLETERRTDPVSYSVSRVRLYGYMHELLLSLYIFKNKLKKYESQLTWVTDELTESQFNSIPYKIAANCSFFFNKPR